MGIEKIKENWNKKDELCSHCNNVVKPAKGLNKQNMKKLFSLKVKLSDFIVLIMMALILYGAWAYHNDTVQCRYMVNNFDQLCFQRMQGTAEGNASTMYKLPPSFMKAANVTIVASTNITETNETETKTG